MIRKRIAVGGSAADPPHVGHLALLKALLQSDRFDLVVWISSGERLGKKLQTLPDHRVAMTELLIPDEWRLLARPQLIVSYHDVYGENTPTIVWLERLHQAYPHADLKWFTGIDSITPAGKYGKRCEIQATWVRGEELMRKWKFLILPRAGYIAPVLVRPLLPKHFNFETLDVELPDVASSEIRKAIAKGVSAKSLVERGWLTDNVARYIANFQLYKQGV